MTLTTEAALERTGVEIRGLDLSRELLDDVRKVAVHAELLEHSVLVVRD